MSSAAKPDFDTMQATRDVLRAQESIAARIVHKTTCAINSTGHRGPCTCGADTAATCQHNDAVVSPSGDITCNLCGAVKSFRGEWPDRSAATSGSGLTDYDKGYLDGLLQGTASAGDKWSEVYEAKAKAYLDKRGFKGWKVNASRI